MRNLYADILKSKKKALAQLDALNQAVISTPPEVPEGLAMGIHTSIVRILEPHIRLEDGNLLQEIIDQIEKQIKASVTQSRFNNQNVSGNDVFGGSFYTAIRDNNVGGGR